MSVQRERTKWMQLLVKKAPPVQYEIVRTCSLDFIRDLHKLIKYIAYDKNLEISPKYKTFLKKHRTFLLNFLGTRSCKKKRENLLRKVNGGFLSLLIPAIVSIAGSVIPALLDK